MAWLLTLQWTLLSLLILAPVAVVAAATMAMPRSSRDRALAYGGRSRMAESASVSHHPEPEGGGLT